MLAMLLGVNSCATYTADVNPISEDSDITTVSTSIYLIGDAGFLEDNKTSTALTALEKRFRNAKSKDVLLFLGDNIYPKGMPQKKSGVKRKNAEKSLEAQLVIAEKFPGKVIFIPGNHDWYNGIDGLKEEEKMVEKALGKNSFLPENGCPLDTYDISENIILITIDSEWFLTNWDQHPKINDNCDIKSRAQFFDEFKSIVNKNQNKQMIIAMHHPLETNGNHGGQFKFSILKSPINVLRRASGVSPADTNFPLYREFSNKITTLLQEYKDNVIVVSGHEHNLQYLKYQNIPQIISGSGSKVRPVRNYKNNDSVFGYAGLGFSILNISKDKQQVHFFDENNDLIHASVINNNNSNSATKIISFPQESIKSTSIYPYEEPKSTFYNTIMGKHYRAYYYKDYSYPIVKLDTLYGGLKPIKLGGGNQSVSLRLEDKDGKEYVMRRMSKSATQFLQINLFQENYIRNNLKNSVLEECLKDFYTTAYPFAPLIISELSESAGVYYSKPEIFYVPYQKGLSTYNERLGNNLYLFEERMSKESKGKSYFGDSDDIVSTDEVLERISKDEKYKINTNLYIRTRLFDMWLGDWDRHADQFRWAVFKKSKDEIIYEPIPRDRDQAFSNFDGLFTRTLTSLIPALRKFQRFENTIKNVTTFNSNAISNDIAILNQTQIEQWIKQAEELEKSLSNETIDQVFNNLPEALQDNTTEEIKEKLIQRKKHLSQWAKEYYKFLNKNIIIRGTDKDDIFEITRLENGSTHIKVTRNKSNSNNTVFYEKTYQPEFTKEIWLYGLDDTDHFIVKGNAKECLKIRIIGGQGKDRYTIENSYGIKIYDYKSKKSVFEGKPVEHLLTDDYKLNNYDYNKFKHNFRQILPHISYNPDEGLITGAKAKFTLYGFENNPFWQKHSIGVKYFTSTNGFEIAYNNEIANAIRNYNFAFETRYTTPAYSINFYGYGNETPNLEEINNIEYMRVRLEQFNAKMSILKRGRLGSVTKFSIPLDIINPNENENRYIETVFTSAKLKSTAFLGAEFTYEYENLNSKAFPTLGIEFAVSTGWKTNVSKTNQNFAYLNPLLQLNYPIIKNGVLTLAALWNGNLINNSNFEFYQAASIGGQNGLRGYRNQRFTGKKSFYQNTDLKWQLFNFNAGLVPAKFGVLGGFDYGRVWLDNDNSKKWHNSFGGGVFVNGSGLFSLQTSYFNSNDGGRFVFSLGMGF
jgi:predicted phosphodiesterase